MELSEILALIETKTGQKPTPAGGGFTARCPAHEDGKPSLSVGHGAEGRILLNCHAGCSFEAVLNALNLKAADLAPGKGNRRGRPAKSTITAAYDYRDAAGTLLFQVCRMEPKGFLQRRPDKASVDGWAWNMKGVRQVPYRLPELIAAVKAGQTVFIAEGEKDVAALVSHEFPATCNAGGAGKWRTEFGEYFDGAKSIVVIADKDEPGRKHAAEIAAWLKPLCRSVKVLELPDQENRPVKDAADFFAAGGTADALRACVDAAPEFELKEEVTPSTWFRNRFPELEEKHGQPVQKLISGKREKVIAVSHDFMAAAIGLDGSPACPTVFLPSENRFYTYDPGEGIFVHQREEDIAARFSNLFLECVKACGDAADTGKLAFQFREHAAICGIVKRAKGILAVAENFFARDSSEFLPVANGVLRLADKQLLPFSPMYHCRHKLAVNYVPGAYCHRFMETLLKAALSPPDVYTIQLWTGSVLLGVNYPQKIMLLTGTAGGGKSTLVEVIMSIIGKQNVGTLRSELLGDRFELGRLMDKTLLYGPDVKEDFLTAGAASSLKSLTGGDLVTVEFKNSNECPQLKCQFNVIVTSNSRLTVYLEGDAEAWRRRLVIVDYNRPKPENPIADLAAQIIREEGPGVLNFMLEGLDQLRDAKWQLTMTEEQKRRVDDLLLESESIRVFVEECLVKDTAAQGITKADIHIAYTDYCEKRGWQPIQRVRFGKSIVESIAQTFHLSLRGDITGPDGKQKDGWKNLRVKKPNEAEM